MSMRLLSRLKGMVQSGLFDEPDSAHTRSDTALIQAGLIPVDAIQANDLQSDITQPLLAEPPATAPEPLLALRHPRADREIELQGQLVGYHLRRARRRSIGILVTTEGVRVSAPRWVGLKDIDAVLKGKEGWIIAKLVEQHERALQLNASRVEWRSGAALPYMGGTLVLVLGSRSRSSATFLEGPGHGELHLNLPETAPPERIARAVQKWLKQQALAVFDARCNHYAAQMGVAFKTLALSSARTRWGSASSTGSIRLHWRLIHFPMSTIDYVVVHELAHLREMNHSPRFWSIVREVLPDYEESRSALKTQVLPVLD